MKKMKGIDGKLDDAWSLLVKLIAGEKCEYCGKKEYLNSHHVYSRSNRSVRWDTDNGYCLCVGHHTFGNMSAHKAPMEFSEWMKSDRGIEWHEKLMLKANSTSKLMTHEKQQILDELNRRICEF